MKLTSYKIRLIIAGIVGIVSLIAILSSFYPIQLLDIQFTPLVQRLIFDFSAAAIVLFTVLLLGTLIFGRFYCSTICPFGILQEFMSLLTKRKKNNPCKNYGFKYLIAGLTFGALFGGSALLIRYIDPYTIFASAVTLTVYGIIFVLCVLVIVFYKNRFFCTNICPVGTILGLLSKHSLFKIYIDKEKCVACAMCAKNCQTGCISKFTPESNDNSITKPYFNIDNEMCINCLKCLSVCPKGAVNYGIKPVAFNITRRRLLFGAGALSLVAAGYAAGLQLTQNFIKKVTNIFTPAGSISLKRMANKCLNCNLCISKCPNKILVKADKDFPAVHIDYSKGKGYCKYDCNNCSQACPSGAIKKITLDEKRSTRIGMAFVNEKCTQCGTCFGVCPTDAITWQAGQNALVDGSKCVGCGKCAAKCPSEAINIFALKEHSKI